MDQLRWGLRLGFQLLTSQSPHPSSVFSRSLSERLTLSNFFPLQLLRDVKSMKHNLIRDEGGFDPVILATKLSSVGYRVNIRSALGGAAGSADCFYNLRNEFLIISGEGDDYGENFILETAFKEHFAIPQPTERYAGLLEAVPEEVVLPPATLGRLVNLLQAEMSLAFQERGLSLPPWRQGKSLLSKWLPKKARDSDMSSPSGSPRAAAAAAAAGAWNATGTSPEYSGELTISALSSGILTPSALLGDDSPRAVLRGAAAYLSNGGGRRDAKTTPLAVRPGTKQRSLLTSDLIASGNVTPKASTGEKKATETAATRAQQPAARGNLGWATPPIRTVKMAGAPAVTGPAAAAAQAN